LDSFSQTVSMEARILALNIFSQKLIKSGHSLKTIRGILLSGITGHVRKVDRSKTLKPGVGTRVPTVGEQRNCWQEASGSEVARKERKRRKPIPKHIKGRGEQQE
jgi:hypothetical protein